MIYADDNDAWSVLDARFEYSDGAIRPRVACRPTDLEWEAISYLIEEWDYAYSSTPALPGPAARP